MYILEKTGAAVRSLTLAERELVEAFASGTLSGSRWLAANQWLGSLRGAGHWLGCDCNAKAQPVMNVTLNGSTGTLYLKNNPGTPEHAAGCPFTKVERDTSEHTDAPVPATWLAPDTPLRLLADFDTEAAQRRPPRLLSLLLTWIEASGLNVHATARHKDLTGQFAELRAVAARYPLIERVPAANFLETRLDIKHMMMLKARLKDTAAFASHRRHGLLLDCIDQASGRKLFTARSDKGLDFQGHHQLWGGAKASGPLLTLVLYSPLREGSQFFELIHVATVPVLSKGQLFPVWRDEEREPLKMLFSLIDWMADKGVKVTLRRPVIGAHAEELILSDDQARVLSVSLLDRPTGPEPTDDSFRRLADFKSLDTFRKYVAGYFMRGR